MCQFKASTSPQAPPPWALELLKIQIPALVPKLCSNTLSKCWISVNLFAKDKIGDLDLLIDLFF